MNTGIQLLTGYCLTSYCSAREGTDSMLSGGEGAKASLLLCQLNKRQERDVIASLGSPLLVFLNLRIDTNRCSGTENRQTEAGGQFTASKRRAPGWVSSPSHSFLGEGKRQAGMEVSHVAGRGQELYKKEKAV